MITDTGYRILLFATGVFIASFVATVLVSAAVSLSLQWSPRTYRARIFNLFTPIGWWIVSLIVSYLAFLIWVAA